VVDLALPGQVGQLGTRLSCAGDHPSTLENERSRDRKTDAFARARHDREFAGELKVHGCS
jgi:hypothetical protein